MAGRLMNNEMGRIWKEVVVEQLRYYLRIFVLKDSGIPGKSSFRLAGVQDENRTKHLHNTNLERILYISHLGIKYSYYHHYYTYGVKQM
jgi:hypothetical protein